MTEGVIKNPPSGFRIIVPSKYVAEECERISLKYETIIPHGFDPHQFNVDNKKAQALHEKIAGDKIMFYCLGGYTELNQLRKGYGELFKVIKIVRKEVGNRFVVYIRTLYPFIIGTMDGVDLTDVVVINPSTYSVSDYEIALEMTACDCYLASSLAEGFCMPALEASYGCGKPVIYPDASPYSDYLYPEVGYPVPMIREKVVKYNLPHISYGYYVRIRYWDIEEFANAMIKVIESPNEACRKGNKAYANRFSWTIYNTYNRFKTYIDL